MLNRITTFEKKRHIAVLIIIALLIVSCCNSTASAKSSTHYYVDASTGIQYSYVIGTDYHGEEFAEITGAETAEYPEILTIPDSFDGVPVKSFATGAFENKSHNGDGLKEVRFPAIKFLANKAFSRFTNLKVVDVGLSDCIFAGDVFNECPAIESFKKNPRNNNYNIDEYGVLYDSAFTSLIKYPPACSTKEYSVNEKTIYIKEKAFQWSDIKEIKLPASLRAIYDYAFSECVQLRSIVIPENVTMVGEYAFYKCSSLKSAEYKCSRLSISTCTFAMCTSLKSVVLPEGLITIANQAFYKTGLVNVKVPDSTEYLFPNSFADCEKLEKIYIGPKTDSIASTAFSNHSEKLTIYGLENSYAQSWAKQLGVNFCVGTAEDVPLIIADDTDDENTDGENTDGENTNGDSGQTHTDNQDDPPPNQNDPLPIAPPVSLQSQIITGQGTLNKTCGCKPFYLKVTSKTSLSFKSSNVKAATVDKTGKITVLKPGKVKIFITAKQSNKYKSAKKTIILNISLKKPLLKATAKKGSKVKLTWGKVPAASGYKVYICEPGKTNFVCRVTKNANVKSVTHRGLQSGKAYKYKIRAFTKVGKSIQYSPYSKVKKVTIK